MESVGLIIIGNELLNGKIADKNTFELSKKLSTLNLTLKTSLTIEDSYSSFEHAMKLMINLGVDLILTSGGLGPTKDDKTKDFIAEFHQLKISFHQEADECVKRHYERKKRSYQETDEGYSFFPETCRPLDNPTGVAPGILFENNSYMLAAFPGVPIEFSTMFNQSLEPIIEKKNGKVNQVHNFIFKTKGVGESKIFTQIDDQLWTNLEAFGNVSSLPHSYGVDIGVQITAKNNNELDDKKKDLSSLISESPISPYIWHVGHESLEEIIIKKANDKNLTFGFAESCTGGLCSSRITNFTGSSQPFLGAIISYSNSVKENSLQVPKPLLASHGAVSEEVARSMAKGARVHLGVDIAISLTGIAGPNGGSEHKPVGTVCMGFSTKEETNSKKYQFSSNRIGLKQKFSQVALFHLLQKIEEYKG